MHEMFPGGFALGVQARSEKRMKRKAKSGAIGLPIQANVSNSIKSNSEK
jgi:hypothetical protein